MSDPYFSGNQEYVVERIVREREVLPSGEVGDWKIVSSTPVSSARLDNSSFPTYLDNNSISSNGHLQPSSLVSHIQTQPQVLVPPPSSSQSRAVLSSSYVPLAIRTPPSPATNVMHADRFAEKYLEFRSDDSVNNNNNNNSNNNSTAVYRDTTNYVPLGSSSGHRIVYWEDTKPTITTTTSLPVVHAIDDEPRYRFVGPTTTSTAATTERFVPYQPISAATATPASYVAPSYHAPAYVSKVETTERPLSTLTHTLPVVIQSVPTPVPTSTPVQQPQQQHIQPHLPEPDLQQYSSFGAEQANDLLATVSQAPDPSVDATEFRNITRDDFYRKHGGNISVPIEWEKIPLGFAAKDRAHLQSTQIPVLSFIQHFKQVPVNQQRPVFLIEFPDPFAASRGQQQQQQQRQQVILCRQKRSGRKLRLSYDPNKLVKSRNPGHIGTIVDKTAAGRFDQVSVQLLGKREVAIIQLAAQGELLDVNLFIANTYCSNGYDPMGPSGPTMAAQMGLHICATVFANFIPNETMQFHMAGSDRICMCLLPGGRIQNSNGSATDITVQHALQVDYPITPFLAFALLSTIFSWRIAHGCTPSF